MANRQEQRQDNPERKKDSIEQKGRPDKCLVIFQSAFSIPELWDSEIRKVRSVRTGWIIPNRDRFPRSSRRSSSRHHLHRTGNRENDKAENRKTGITPQREDAPVLLISLLSGKSKSLLPLGESYLHKGFCWLESATSGQFPGARLRKK